MNLSNREKFHYYLALGCVAAGFAGLIISRALLSISMITLVINAIADPKRKEYLTYYLSLPALWSVSLIFFIYAVGYWYSEDLSYWWQAMQIKVPFMLLPFAFVSLKKISKKDFERLLLVFLLLILGSVVYVLIRYYFDKDTVRYWTGNVMETPFSHVRYSLMVALAIFICIYLFVEKFRWVSDYDRIVILCIGILLFAFMHILAVRSGLIAVYITGFIILIRYVIKYGKWVSGISFLIGLLLVPFLAYKFIPTFKEKVNYVKYNVERYVNANEISTLSDGQRFYSMKQGLQVWKENFLFGVGIGDLPKAAEEKYSEFPEIDAAHRLPHSEWIWIGASTGMIGFLICMFSFFIPFWHLRNNMNILLIAFLTIIHTSFFTEATIEEQIGTGFYLLFLLLFFIYYNENRDS